MKFLCDLAIAFGQCQSDLPEIQPCGYIDIHTASSILLDVMEFYEDPQAGLFLPDKEIACFDRYEVQDSYDLQKVSSLSYVKEKNDCDDFARKLYGRLAGLIWTNVHALNFIFDENGKFWFIEPQNKKISETLEPWQGSEFQFFLAR